MALRCGKITKNLALIIIKFSNTLRLSHFKVFGIQNWATNNCFFRKYLCFNVSIQCRTAPKCRTTCYSVESGFSGYGWGNIGARFFINFLLGIFSLWLYLKGDLLPLVFLARFRMFTAKSVNYRKKQKKQRKQKKQKRPSCLLS